MGILKMYTDGACSGNQSAHNFGGWGAILEYGDARKELHGGEADTTNNRMELTAVIEAFRALNRDGVEVQVFSDSSYVMNCFRQGWYRSWEKNGWKNSKKEAVENQDLWKELLALVRRHHVSFYRVKGHVSLDSRSNANFQKLYAKFRSWNGDEFSYDDFIYVTKMNNRADELANVGVDEVREGALSEK